MPPEQRPIPRFIAEPPHDALPYGRWADQLRGLFLDAVRDIDPEDGDELGDTGEISWFPERTLDGADVVSPLHWVALVLACLLFVYLVVALFRPERF